MNQNLQNILDDFSYMTEWEDKYTYIIDLAKNLKKIDSKYQTDEYKVEGCMSQVWLAKNEELSNKDVLYFYADSDAIIVKGLVALLVIIYNGQSPQNIKNINIQNIFKQLGLESHLSPIRRNGFYAMVQKIQTMAKE